MKNLLSSTLLLSALFTFLGCTTSSTYEVKRNIAYVSGGGERQQGDLYLPKSTGPHPIALVVHGGGWVGGSRSQMDRAAEVLVKKGFAAFNINYRLAPEHTHPAQLNDTHAALRYLAKNADQWHIDIERLVAVGYSAGAQLVLLAAEIPDPKGPEIRAISVGGAPVDLTLYPESPVINKLIGGPPSEYPETWKRASPINHILANHPPTFIYHAQWDQIVDPKNAYMLQEALNEAGVRNELQIRHFLGHLLVGFYLQPSIRDSIPFFEAAIN